MSSLPYTYLDVAKMIDHSLLQPFLTEADMEKGIALALAYDVASVCILPCWIPLLVERVAESTVIPSCTIGFPHGANLTAIKVREAEAALASGAKELDMVANISWVKSGRWEDVESDIRAVVECAHAAEAKVKVIFENCYLTDDEKIHLCEVCGRTQADWVKTSTGYGTGGATMDDLALMRKHAPSGVQVKAAGGVRDLDTLLQVRAAGATRCGASATTAMMDEARLRLCLEPIVAAAGPVGTY